MRPLVDYPKTIKLSAKKTDKDGTNKNEAKKICIQMGKSLTICEMTSLKNSSSIWFYLKLEVRCKLSAWKCIRQ